MKLHELGHQRDPHDADWQRGTLYIPQSYRRTVYRVDVEISGFKHFTQDKVEVQVDVTTRVDAALQVGNVAETVLVTTEAPPLQTDSASLGATIRQEEVESIPTERTKREQHVDAGAWRGCSRRHVWQCSQQPGRRRTGQTPLGSAITRSVAASATRARSMLMASLRTHVAGNLNALIPSQDVVQEFRVATNNVSAEYGSYAGGVINMTTKSGTNVFPWKRVRISAEQGSECERLFHESCKEASSSTGPEPIWRYSRWSTSQRQDLLLRWL